MCEDNWETYCKIMETDGTYVDTLFITMLTMVLQIKIRFVQTKEKTTKIEETIVYVDEETETKGEDQEYSTDSLDVDDGMIQINSIYFITEDIPTIIIEYHHIHQHYISFINAT